METRPEHLFAISGSIAPLPAFEKQLKTDLEWGLSEASLFLDGKGAVHETLRRVCKRLDEAGVAYAVVGGMALYAQGFQRFTKDVDLLVSPQGLNRIHAELEGLGYVRVFPGSKNLRDTHTRVNIEFLVEGQYPGDGKPKPVAFPDPRNVSVELNGIHYLNLPTLVELKLASGLSNPDRMKDLSDVQELIKAVELPRDLQLQLNPYVREKYLELWDAVKSVQRRYVLLWRNKWLTSSAATLDEMIASIHAAAETLAAMKADGVVLDHEGGTADDYAYLVTSDPEIARKYDMHDESEFWNEGEGDTPDNVPGE